MMGRRTDINAIWRATIFSFAFVEIVGAAVFFSVITSGRAPYVITVLGYILFLLLTWLFYLLLKYIKSMIERNNP